jgi:hypothetical protein
LKQVSGLINVAGHAEPVAFDAINRQLPQQGSHSTGPTLATRRDQRRPAQQQWVPRQISVEGADNIRVRNLRTLNYPLDRFSLQPSEITEHHQYLLGDRRCGEPSLE